MPRSSNQKRKLAVLREILSEHTDAEHPMTMKEIIKELGAKGISAERKSIYDDIEVLRVLGTDIQTKRGKTVGYYVANRDFELPELKLLVDAVRSSRFIPEKQSNQLIKKLTHLAGAYDRPSLNREMFVSNKAKSLENDLFKTVDIIHEAIEKDRDITFFYFSWTVRKEKELRRGGEKYQISPWSLVWDDSNYYLVGFDVKNQEIRHFRVDKMLKANGTDIPRTGKTEFDRFDISSYANAAFGMFGGKMEKVTLRCAKRLANVMLDRFGRDTVILNDIDTFRITVNIIPSPVFLGWIWSFGKEVEIISPEYVKEQFRELESNRT